MQIIIDDDRIVNIFKKHAKVYYKFTAMGILFPASVKNDIVTYRELKDANPATIMANRKTCLPFYI